MGALENTLKQVFPQDAEYRAKAKARLDQLAVPHWALGDLMDLAIDLAGMTRSMTPPVGRKAIVTMAGDHGVTVEGVSKFPKEVTPQMVVNFVNGGAGINALARQAGARGLRRRHGGRRRPARSGRCRQDHQQEGRHGAPPTSPPVRQ